MSDFSIPLTRLVHENLSIVMTFAYSQQPLALMLKRRVQGPDKYQEKALFELSAIRAEKACLELALFLRMVDDEEKITEYHSVTKTVLPCVKLVMRDGTEKELTFRDVSNKILHSSRLEWDLAREPDPMLISYSRDEEKWARAEIDLVAISFMCGRLMS